MVGVEKTQAFDALLKQVRPRFRGNLHLAEPMARHTTFRIGGAADVYAVPADEADVQVLLQAAEGLEVPWLVVGDGANLLVRDRGIRGVVMNLARLDEVQKILEGGSDGQIRFRVGIGARLRRVALWAARQGFSGLEFAAQIPGTLGGAVVMNAGTPEGDMAGVLESVALVFPDGRREEWGVSPLGLGYRSSKLPRAVMVSVTLTLRPENTEAIQRRIQALSAQRRERQPLGYPNAGSVFKNPTGEYAGRLIELAGLKGRRKGGAVVSEQHANFILNTGDATAQDVLTLMGIIQDAVYRHSGVWLEPEIRIVGED